MRKRIVILIMLVMLLDGFVPKSVEAKESYLEPEYSIQWKNIKSFSTSLSNSENSINVYVSASSMSSGQDISGYIYLQKYSSGKWITTISWKINGNSRYNIMKMTQGEYGSKYRVMATINIGGENATVYSNSIQI